MALPDPEQARPLVLPDGSRHRATVFLRAIIDHPNIEVGAFTYAHDSTEPEDFAVRLAPYLFPGAPECLRIGKFCQIAEGVRFVTATANHPMDGISTYPFAVFDEARFSSYRRSLPRGRDTVVGHDCWLGRDAMLLPGATLGNGVVVGAGAVVGGTVPDYAVVAGNPATIVRMRFSNAEIATLNRLAWWDWPVARIEAALAAIEGGDVQALERFHAEVTLRR
ncbi:MAG: CatB-related O-acetyltransferase [Pseudomonadota bacterium]